MYLLFILSLLDSCSVERLLLGNTVAGVCVLQPEAMMGWGYLSSLSSPLLRGRPRELVRWSQGHVQLWWLCSCCPLCVSSSHLGDMDDVMIIPSEMHVMRMIKIKSTEGL